MIDRTKIDSFTQGYIEAALWSTNDESTPDGGEPMDANYGIADLSDECLEAVVKRCALFQARYARILARLTERHGHSDAYHGHNLWLTQCGHGTGFWDCGYGKLGDALTTACQALGEVWLYVGDDGKIHGVTSFWGTT
jgi:hypothetical protein